MFVRFSATGMFDSNMNQSVVLLYHVHELFDVWHEGQERHRRQLSRFVHGLCPIVNILCPPISSVDCGADATCR